VFPSTGYELQRQYPILLTPGWYALSMKQFPLLLVVQNFVLRHEDVLCDVDNQVDLRKLFELVVLGNVGDNLGLFTSKCQQVRP
jgi:hypothetical protein